MGSFTDTVAGNLMHASDVNQLVDVLNGTRAGQLSRLAPAGNGVPWTAQLPSGVVGGSQWFNGSLSGDASARIVAYLNPNSMGGLAGSNGNGTFTAHLDGGTGGWTFVDYLTLGNLTTSGTVNAAGINATTCTITGGASTCSGTSYNLAAANLINGGTWTIGTAGASMSISDDSGGSTIDFSQTRAGSAARAIEVGGWSGSAGAYGVFGSTTTTGGSFTGVAIWNEYGTHKGFSGISGFEGVTVSGSSATISHGLGRSPDSAVVCIGSGSTVDAWTGCSSDTWGSSTITVHLSATNYTVSGIVTSFNN